jgi:hypothetical protein
MKTKLFTLIAAVMIMASCKKEDIQPEPKPEPTPHIEVDSTRVEVIITVQSDEELPIMDKYVHLCVGDYTSSGVVTEIREPNLYQVITTFNIASNQTTSVGFTPISNGINYQSRNSIVITNVETGALLNQWTSQYLWNFANYTPSLYIII